MKYYWHIYPHMYHNKTAVSGYVIKFFNCIEAKILNLHSNGTANNLSYRSQSRLMC